MFRIHTTLSPHPPPGSVAQIAITAKLPLLCPHPEKIQSKGREVPPLFKVPPLRLRQHERSVPSYVRRPFPSPQQPRGVSCSPSPSPALSSPSPSSAPVASTHPPSPGAATAATLLQRGRRRCHSAKFGGLVSPDRLGLSA